MRVTKRFLRKIGAGILTLATVFAMLPQISLITSAEDNPTPRHTLEIATDGLRPDENNNYHPYEYRVKYSFDNNTWYNPFNDNSVDDFNPFDEQSQFNRFDLEGTDQHPVVVPDSGPLYIDIEYHDNPAVPNGHEKRIALVGLNDRSENGRTELNPHDNGQYFSGSLHFTYMFNDISDIETGDLYVICLALSYPREGRREITEKALDYIYAYSGADAAANKILLAKDLYSKFLSVSMFGRFDYNCVDWHDDQAGFEADVELFNSYIEPGVASGPITVTLADGTQETRDVYTYKVHWGFDENGERIVSEIPVIQLTDPKEVIICTDFDNTTGLGNTYYSRIVHRDEVPFINYSTNPEENLSSLLVADSNFPCVRAGGNGSDTFTTNTDGLYTFDINTNGLFDNIVQGYGSKVRVIDPSETYVAVGSIGETKDYDGLGINGLYTDNIWRTGDGAEARVYIGDDTVYLLPLTLDVLTTKKITNVELKDETQKDGVSIDTSNLNAVKLTFKSNFYDSVPLIITYEGNVTKELTIVRVGLVINYSYLMDDGSNHGIIRSDTKGDLVEFDYDYNAGEQIIVYATYYHPSSDATVSGGDDLYLSITYDDNNTEILPHTGYKPADAGTVAMTTFIIGFAPAHKYDGYMWTDEIPQQFFKNKFGNRGGFSATVINGGYDDDTSFGGTQIGSGKGVYWDGNIKWFTN